MPLAPRLTSMAQRPSALRSTRSAGAARRSTPGPVAEDRPERHHKSPDDFLIGDGLRGRLEQTLQLHPYPRRHRRPAAAYAVAVVLGRRDDRPCPPGRNADDLPCCAPGSRGVSAHRPPTGNRSSQRTASRPRCAARWIRGTLTPSRSAACGWPTAPMRTILEEFQGVPLEECSESSTRVQSEPTRLLSGARVHEPRSHHRRPESLFARCATHSTWCVIGNTPATLRGIADLCSTAIGGQMWPLTCNDADFRGCWRQGPVAGRCDARPNRALLSAGSDDRKRAQGQVRTRLPAARRGQHT